MRSIDQDDPSHRSANGPELEFSLYDRPTATHALLEAHDTAESHPDQPAVVDIGVCWVDHVEPFQRSTNGTGSFVAGTSRQPTATQARVDVHDTPLSSVSPEFGGLGTGSIDQPAAAAD